MSDLITYFQQRQASMVEMLTRLIELESFTPAKPQVDALSAHLGHLLAQSGADVTVYPRDTVGDIRLGRWHASAPGQPILILAHMDTVWPIGTLAERPVTIDDEGRLFGPGAVDMKGGIALTLTAIQGLRERGELPERPLWFLLTTDEERGSGHSQALIEDLARSAGLVLVVEPPNRDGSLKTWRKGVASYHLTIEGRPAHAGNEPEMGINSVIEFAQQALEIHQLNDLKNGTSVSVTMVQGGSASNVIPARTEASIDVRTLTMQAFQQVDQALRARNPYIPGAKVSIELGSSRPPMERTAHTFDQARAIAAQYGVTLREDGAGGGSDGNFTAALGIPTLDGLGAEGGGMHANDEHVLIAGLARKAALMAMLLKDWAF